MTNEREGVPRVMCDMGEGTTTRVAEGSKQEVKEGGMGETVAVGGKKEDMRATNSPPDCLSKAISMKAGKAFIGLIKPEGVDRCSKTLA